MSRKSLFVTFGLIAFGAIIGLATISNNTQANTSPPDPVAATTENLPAGAVQVPAYDATIATNLQSIPVTPTNDAAIQADASAKPTIVIQEAGLTVNEATAAGQDVTANDAADDAKIAAIRAKKEAPTSGAQ